MSMAEMIPTLADADLVSLQSNATRLQTTGTDKQQRDGDRAVDDKLGAAQFGHATSVPGRRARVARSIERFGYGSSSSS
jgi:hypothetical protein